MHIITNETSRKTWLLHELTGNTGKDGQSEGKSIRRKNDMPTHNQSNLATHLFNSKDVVSYYKIVVSIFESYCKNPKPTPKTEFGSRRHKELATIRNNETRAKKIDFEKSEECQS